MTRRCIKIDDTLSDLRVHTLTAELIKVDIHKLVCGLNLNPDADIGEFIKAHFYDGDYVVKSSFEDFVLPTKNKYLMDDISIRKMNQSETTNDSGGYTLYIGDED